MFRTFLTELTTLKVCGKDTSSKDLAYGTGMSAPVHRTGAESRWLNAGPEREECRGSFIADVW